MHIERWLSPLFLVLFATACGDDISATTGPGGGGTGGTGGGGGGGASVALLKKGTGSITFAGNAATQLTIGSGGTPGANGTGSPANGTASKQYNVA